MTEPRAFAHHPVLAPLVVDLFAPVPSGWIVDATLGGAGHATALLESRADLSVLGLDRDPAAMAVARDGLARWGARATTRLDRFDRLATVVAGAGAAVQPVVGCLFDLGVSSPQLDDPARGFSYRHPGPIDMRMSGEGPSAFDVVNGAGVEELAAILVANADERFARRIARAVVAARPLLTTTELAAVVTGAIPAAARRRGGHPAKRTFQALRIHVNEELEMLPAALGAALDVLSPGGRLVAISYHSGEDRIVKSVLRTAATGGCSCPPGLPCACGARPVARLVRRGAWTASPAEVAANRRAASARLRAVEKLPITSSEDQR